MKYLFDFSSRVNGRREPRFLLLLAILVCLATWPTATLALEGPATEPTVAAGETPIAAPDQVDIQPTARDDEIGARLESILQATGWFVTPVVRVQDGVVFLTGQTTTAEHRTWAGDLARNTQSVAAVVNLISVMEPPVWDVQPVLFILRQQVRVLVRALPIIALSLSLLAIFLLAARLTSAITHRALRRRVSNPLLLDVIAWCLGLVVLLVGLYLVFQATGLTNIALTVLGSAGLLGVILGIAFRDVTENFLASIFLSAQTPFHTGDLVEIVGIVGFVQKLTPRATILMTPDGTYVQIPNATVYTNTIHNYTSNPNSRKDFVVSIDYDEDVAAAQEVVLRVLEEHPAVLKDPEPSVLVESLGTFSVDLHVFYWVDGTQHSVPDVQSSVIRLIKQALQAAGISMTGEARELVLAKETPIQALK
jgi:small-conductance mechanosensitive channel